MKKFYAPTGSFKPGPIVVSGASTPDSPSAEAPPVRRTTEEQTSSEKGVAAENSSAPPAEEPPPTGDSQERPSEAPAPGTTLLSSSSRRPDTAQPGRPSGPENLKPARPGDKTVTARAPGRLRAAREAASTSQTTVFEDFARKWKRYLYPGQLSVMRALFEMTFVRGTSECFTRYSEIAATTKMSRRNCINVMNSLVERGFVERLEVRNDATGKGIKLRVHPEPLS